MDVRALGKELVQLGHTARSIASSGERCSTVMFVFAGDTLTVSGPWRPECEARTMRDLAERAAAEGAEAVAIVMEGWARTFSSAEAVAAYIQAGNRPSGDAPDDRDDVILVAGVVPGGAATVRMYRRRGHPGEVSVPELSCAEESSTFLLRGLPWQSSTRRTE